MIKKYNLTLVLYCLDIAKLIGLQSFCSVGVIKYLMSLDDNEAECLFDFYLQLIEKEKNYFDPVCLSHDPKSCSGCPREKEIDCMSLNGHIFPREWHHKTIKSIKSTIFEIEKLSATVENEKILL